VIWAKYFLVTSSRIGRDKGLYLSQIFIIISALLLLVIVLNRFGSSKKSLFLGYSFTKFFNPIIGYALRISPDFKLYMFNLT